MLDSNGIEFVVGSKLCSTKSQNLMIECIKINSEIATFQYINGFYRIDKFSLNQHNLNISNWIVVKELSKGNYGSNR